MRVMQYRILKRILNKINIPNYIYAFEVDKSIPEMARAHVGKKIVISLDIKDFFPSIKQATIQKIFTDLGIAEKPARTLSEICTYKAYVPQGALTSPKISNLVSSVTFGPIIKEYCDNQGLTLSIYADDITVSSTREDLDAGQVIQFLTDTVSSFGFRINRAKTKVMRSKRRQYVCGVVVNEKTNLLKRERQRLRAVVHNITVNGLEAEAAKNNITAEEFLNQIRGKVNWLYQLNPPLGEKLMNQLRTVPIPQTTVQEAPTETNIEADTEPAI